MDTLKEIIENIIRSKARIVPVFIYDELGSLKGIIKALNNDIDVFVLESSSKIAMQNCLNRCNHNNYCAIYSNYNIDIDGLVGTKKLIRLEITPTLLLKHCNKTKDILEKGIELTKGQYKLLMDNFDMVIGDIANNKTITRDTLKLSLARAFIGECHSPRDMIISFLKGSFDLDEAKSLYLYEEIRLTINEIYNININEFENNKDLLEKILITLLIEEYKDNPYVEFSDKIIKVNRETLIKIFNFIKENNHCFKSELNKINSKFKNIKSSTITYIIPQMFKNYITDNIENYMEINIDNDYLWTGEMEAIGDFVENLRYLDFLLKGYISFTFHTNSMDSIISEYKKKLWEIDSVYRKLISLLEDLTYDLKLYIRVKESQIIEKLSDKYFNVIGNINSKYISNYNYLLENNYDSIRQDNIFKRLTFKRNTVFIFADGLRYELAKYLTKRIKCIEIRDYDVFSLVPTETEICMNGYFITDEKIRINKRNNYDLIKDDKLITQILNWRTSKLSEIIGYPVITFEDFKLTYNYKDSVVLFYNDVDIAIHNYNSSKKVTATMEELGNVIEYSLCRNFDVMLLSDHGFLDIESKIQVQDYELDPERKKGRYLILPKNEAVDKMYYRKDIQVAEFIEKPGKDICFINSINSLRKTSRYSHGGISLQENIITAILFKSEEIINTGEKKKYLSKLKAFNEIKAEIENAKGTECKVFAGTRMIFMSIINTDKFLLSVPIRNYEKGQEFLITIGNGDYIEKRIIAKMGSTVIDGDLDIF